MPEYESTEIQQNVSLKVLQKNVQNDRMRDRQKDRENDRTINRDRQTVRTLKCHNARQNGRYRQTDRTIDRQNLYFRVLYNPYVNLTDQIQLIYTFVY